MEDALPEQVQLHVAEGAALEHLQHVDARPFVGPFDNGNVRAARTAASSLTHIVDP